MLKETALRSLLKTFSWRLLATATTMILVYIFTGKGKIALAVGGVDALVKMIIYYLHERLWNYSRLGRNYN